MDKMDEMKILVDKLNEWTKLYDEGHPIVSDKTWDDEYFRLVVMENEVGVYYENSPTHRVVYEVKNELEKVEHSHPMLSLAKTKSIDELESFIGNNLCLFMCKMDGLTVSLHYVNGKLIGAETRGDGFTGESVLATAQLIDGIPHAIPTKEEFIIDGEVICPQDVFEAKFAGDFKNPRNYAAGAIRRLDSKENADCGLMFVAWDVIQGFDDCPSLAQKLNYLNSYGFITVPGYVNDSDDCTSMDIINDLKEDAELFHYPIDGIVVKYDDVAYYKSLGVTSHHPSAAKAFKFYDEEYETVLTGIEFDTSRKGIMTPVAIFEPIDDGISEISRASLHNMSVMWETLGKYPKMGQKIWVFKANQIIPQLSKAEKNDIKDKNSLNACPKTCPICGGSTEIVISDSGVKTLMCANPECCGKLTNRIDHFLGKKGLDAKGISRKTIEFLIDKEWVKELKDVFNLESIRGLWEAEPGFGKASVGKILSGIESAESCTFEQIISGAGIPLIGRTVAKQISEYVNGDYTEFRKLVDDKYSFSSWEHFGYGMEKAILNFDYSEIDYIVENYLTVVINEKTETTNDLSGMTFVITGKLSRKRDDIKADIEAAGGKVTGSVSGKTNYLVCNDKNSTTGKSAEAKRLGISVITEDELKEMLDI